MTAERMTRTGSPRAVTPAFNAANSKTGSALVIRDRAAKAVERLSARHRANEAALVAERFAKLWRADRYEPAPKPSWATDNKRGWMYSAARYQVASEFKKRLARVHKVADRMVERVNGKGRQRDGLER